MEMITIVGVGFAAVLIGVGCWFWGRRSDGRQPTDGIEVMPRHLLLPGGQTRVDALTIAWLGDELVLSCDERTSRTPVDQAVAELGRFRLRLTPHDQGLVVEVNATPCEDADFDRVQPFRGGSTYCSPVIPDRWVGVRIAAPQTVTGRRGKDPKVMICGRYRANFSGSRQGPVVVVRDAEAEIRRSTVQELKRTWKYEVQGISVNYVIEAPESASVWKPTRNRRTGGWFNADIGFVIGCSDRERMVFVLARWGDHVSEEVQVRVLAPTDDP